MPHAWVGADILIPTIMFFTNKNFGIIANLYTKFPSLFAPFGTSKCKISLSVGIRGLYFQAVDFISLVSFLMAHSK